MIRFFTVCLIAFILFANKVSAQWSELGGTNALAANGNIYSICSDLSGNIYVAGSFTNKSNNSFVAKFDGTNWSELGAIHGFIAINSVCTDVHNNIYAAGSDSSHCYVAKWNGNSWSELDGTIAVSANNYISSIISDSSGNIYAIGYFTNDSGNYYVAKWDGNTWSELGGPNSLAANDYILSICKDPSGNIYAGGAFGIDNTVYPYVAKFDGQSWSQLGETILLETGELNSVCSDPSGNIYTVGDFSTAIGYRFVAEYNVQNGWGEVGGNNGGLTTIAISSVCSDPSGNIYAGGVYIYNIYNDLYYVAKWNGNSWSALDTNRSSLFNGAINCVFSDAQGNIYAGGNFTNNSGNYYVAKYANDQASIEQVSNQHASITVYPNPSAGQFYFKGISSGSALEIYDMLGQTIYSSTITGETYLLNISGQAKGMYFYRVVDKASSVQQGKLILE